MAVHVQPSRTKCETDTFLISHEQVLQSSCMNAGVNFCITLTVEPTAAALTEALTLECNRLRRCPQSNLGGRGCSDDA